jgi:hypothetical protein
MHCPAGASLRSGARRAAARRTLASTLPPARIGTPPALRLRGVIVVRRSKRGVDLDAGACACAFACVGVGVGVGGGRGGEGGVEAASVGVGSQCVRGRLERTCEQVGVNTSLWTSVLGFGLRLGSG